VDEIVQRAERKRDRPPTTAEYVNVREELARYIAVKEAALKLEAEERISRLTCQEIVRMAEVTPEEVMEREETNPTADIAASRARELQTEILKAIKASSNLKRTHQGSIRKSAEWTLGLIETLRTRLDRPQKTRKSESEEVQALRREQTKFRAEMEGKMAEMRDSMQRAMTAAENEQVKAACHLSLLEQTLREKEDLERKLRQMKEEQAWWWGTEAAGPEEMAAPTNNFVEPMEVVEAETAEVPAPHVDEAKEDGGDGTKEESPPPKRPVITDEDRKAFPIRRPPIQGKAVIIEDRPIDIFKETNERGEKVASPILNMVRSLRAANKKTFGVGEKKEEGARQPVAKKKKKKVNRDAPNWQQMELFGCQEGETTTEEVVQKVTSAVMDLLCGGGDKNMPPPPPRWREADELFPLPGPGTPLLRRRGRRRPGRRKRNRREKRKGGRRRGVV